ncbi:MAG: hypothetical protein CMI03_15235 [Oceanospirillaceae bacterium]|nr:hypothetical protein [Oceanospirillaceae bacterium]MBS54093.1 hypothetical protein [Oceanospirillaceae bacterium]|tara:strand:- start:1538 stop:3643 length:2106 start_codon:yes stop_codon:yes gene_type:complete
MSAEWRTSAHSNNNKHVQQARTTVERNMLKAIMWPAIRLMSQLSYAAKFTLISFLFIVPLVVLSTQVFNSAFQSVERTQQELDGLTVSGDLFNYVHKLERFRDLASVALHKNNDDLNSQLNTLSQALTAQFPQAEQTAQTLSGEGLQDWLSAWKNRFLPMMSLSGEFRQPTFRDQYRFYQIAVDEFYLIIKQFMQQQGISLDSDSSIQRLIGILNTTTDIRARTGLAHGAGIYAFNEQYLQSATYDLMNTSYDQLLAAEPDAEFLISNSSALGEAGLQKNAAEVKDMLLSLRSKIDEEIIMAESVNGSWQEFDQWYLQQTVSLQTTEQQVLPSISQRLQQRLDVQQSRILLLAAVLVTVLTVVAYLYLAFYMSVRHTIKRFSGAAREISGGDLTHEIRFNGKDEMGQMRDAFNDMIARIRTTLSAVKSSSDSVTTNVNEVENIARRSHDAVGVQLEQTEEVSRIISAMAERAGYVAGMASEAETAVDNGQQKSTQADQVVTWVMDQVRGLSQEMTNSVNAVNRLAENSSSISSILETIKGIAEQTNLLALNAAIEAARAGEQGRGFAVVADEVRTLASRTQGSAQEIEELISEVQKNIVSAVDTMEVNRTMVDKTVESSGEVSATLNEIRLSMDNIRDKTGGIVRSANEQQQSAADLESNLAAIRSSGEQTAANAEGTVKAVRSAQQITADLAQRVQQFKV